LEAWTLTQVVVQAAKYTVGRSRPFRDEGPLEFSGVVLFDDTRHSFPSGHTATAWGLIPAYALEYTDHPWIAGALWGAAATVGASRIHDDKHWLSDVVFSAGTGYLSNRAVRAWNGASDRALQVIALPISDGWLASASLPF
jgi:membrane-associated phospholipid phosphatase